jgi:hypothetical protein
MRQPQGMYRCSSVASKGRARRRVYRAPRCRPSTGRIPDRDRTGVGVWLCLWSRELADAAETR